MKKDITSELLNDDEYLKIVAPIMNNSEFQKRKKWKHHEDVSLYEHLVIVSYISYKICQKRKWNYRDAAIGGLLHDFYYKPWQDNLNKKENFFHQHGFVHARQAVYNSYRTFPKFMNKRVENIVKRHMFPLNIVPPRYKEGWIVTYVDKKVSFNVVLNVKAIPKYLGLSRKINGIKKKLGRK